MERITVPRECLIVLHGGYFKTLFYDIYLLLQLHTLKNCLSHDHLRNTCSEREGEHFESESEDSYVGNTNEKKKQQDFPKHQKVGDRF